MLEHLESLREVSAADTDGATQSRVSRLANRIVLIDVTSYGMLKA
jgi:hypothetical protein